MLRCWENEWMEDLCRETGFVQNRNRKKKKKKRERQKAQLYGKVISQLVEELRWWQEKCIIINTCMLTTHTHTHTKKAFYLSDSMVLSLSDYLIQRAENERMSVCRSAFALWEGVCVYVCVCVCVCVCVLIRRGGRAGGFLLQRVSGRR